MKRRFGELQYRRSARNARKHLRTSNHFLPLEELKPIVDEFLPHPLAQIVCGYGGYGSHAPIIGLSSDIVYIFKDWTAPPQILYQHKLGNKVIDFQLFDNQLISVIWNGKNRAYSLHVLSKDHVTETALPSTFRCYVVWKASLYAFNTQTPSAYSIYDNGSFTEVGFMPFPLHVLRACSFRGQLFLVCMKSYLLGLFLITFDMSSWRVIEEREIPKGQFIHSLWATDESLILVTEDVHSSFVVFRWSPDVGFVEFRSCPGFKIQPGIVTGDKELLYFATYSDRLICYDIRTNVFVSDAGWLPSPDSKPLRWGAIRTSAD